jgi:hypothetical protein
MGLCGCRGPSRLEHVRVHGIKPVLHGLREFAHSQAVEKTLNSGGLGHDAGAMGAEPGERNTVDPTKGGTPWP